MTHNKSDTWRHVGHMETNRNRTLESQQIGHTPVYTPQIGHRSTNHVLASRSLTGDARHGRIAGMTNRILLLEYEAEALEQDLLDMDPTTERFWEVTSQLEAIQATLRLLILARG